MILFVDSSATFQVFSFLDPTVREAASAGTRHFEFRSRSWRRCMRSIHLVIMYLSDKLPDLYDLQAPSIQLCPSSCRAA